MPIIKSAIKRVKQSAVKQKRNYIMRRKLKTAIKGVIDVIKAKNTEEGKKLLNTAYKIIDTAAKKHIIHHKNADRKKSRLAKLVGNIGKTPAKEVTKPIKKSTKAKAK